MQERSKTSENIATLTEEKQMLQAENCGLHEHIETLEAEQKTHQMVMSELHRALEDKTRECDARMRDMQREVSTRLDEITVTRHEDKELMRLEFAGLFDEKAGELAAVRQEMAAKEAELHSRDVRISELEYRETELNQTITKLRGKNIDPDICRRTEELLEKCSHNTQDLEAKMASIREQYETGRLKYSNHVTNLTKEICDMKKIIKTKDFMIQELRDKQQKAFVNNFPALNKTVTENTPTADNSNNIKDTPAKTDNNTEIDEINQDKNNNKSAHLTDSFENTTMPPPCGAIPSFTSQPQVPSNDQTTCPKSQPEQPSTNATSATVNKRKRKNQKKYKKKNSVMVS